jgi:hypothetical protein
MSCVKHFAKVSMHSQDFCPIGRERIKNLFKNQFSSQVEEMLLSFSENRFCGN